MQISSESGARKIAGQPVMDSDWSRDHQHSLTSGARRVATLAGFSIGALVFGTAAGIVLTGVALGATAHLLTARQTRNLRPNPQPESPPDRPLHL